MSLSEGRNLRPELVPIYGALPYWHVYRRIVPVHGRRQHPRLDPIFHPAPLTTSSGSRTSTISAVGDRWRTCPEGILKTFPCEQFVSAITGVVLRRASRPHS